MFIESIIMNSVLYSTRVYQMISLLCSLNHVFHFNQNTMSGWIRKCLILVQIHRRDGSMFLMLKEIEKYEQICMCFGCWVGSFITSARSSVNRNTLLPNVSHHLRVNFPKIYMSCIDIDNQFSVQFSWNCYSPLLWPLLQDKIINN